MLGSVISTKGINFKISSRLDSPCVSTQHKMGILSKQTAWGCQEKKYIYYKLTQGKQLQKIKTTDRQVG